MCVFRKPIDKCPLLPDNEGNLAAGVSMRYACCRPSPPLGTYKMDRGPGRLEQSVRPQVFAWLLHQCLMLPWHGLCLTT